MKTVPPVMKFLQDKGIVLSRKEHGLHHKDPFEGHYCILTGTCNEFLDTSNFFRYLEKVVFQLTGRNLFTICIGVDRITQTTLHIGNRPITWNLNPKVEMLAMGITSPFPPPPSTDL